MSKTHVGAPAANSGKSKAIAAVLCACATSVCLSSANGASVTATLANGKAFDALAANGTLGVRAFSQQNQTFNNTVTQTVTIGGVNKNPLPAPPNQMLNTPGYYIATRSPAKIEVPTGMFVPSPLFPGRMNEIVNTFSPTVAIVNNRGPGALNKGDLSMINDQYTINSNTGQYTGSGSAFIDPAGTRRIMATASVAAPLPPPNGAAV